MADSYYDMLGVDPDASEVQIKRAFREKVKEVHPDHSTAANASERFQQIREARDTLLDPNARQRYDQRRKQKQHRSHDDSNETEASSDASQEWAREQQRQRRKQRQRQQAQQRKQRQQRRQHRRQSGTGQTSWGRTRTSRHTDTRTREREETSSQERAQRATANQSVKDRLYAGVAWGQDTYHRPKQWIQTHFHSSEAARQLLVEIATAPTAIRLSATGVLLLILTITAQAVDLSIATAPTRGVAIVLGSLGASYGAYAVLTPLPFETPREHPRFKPANRTPIWPAIALNGTGIGLVGLAAMNGAASAGIGFTVVASVYAGVLLIILSLTFTTLLTLTTGYVSARVPLVQTLKYGLMSAMVGTALVMFTRHPGGGSLPEVFHGFTDPPSIAPWIPAVSVGPVYLGLFANFVLAVVCLGCFLGSVIAMYRYLTVVPWRDRYEHGYQIHPTPWNLAVTAPFVVLLWMSLTGVPAVSLGGIILRQTTLWGGVFVLPTLLIGAYLLRRQLEPHVQEQTWR
jgi:hypothetical protein